MAVMRSRSMVLRKWDLTLMGSNSTRPLGLRQAARVQAQGKEARSTWHRIPPTAQAHDSGSHEPTQSQPHTSNQLGHASGPTSWTLARTCLESRIL